MNKSKSRRKKPREWYINVYKTSDGSDVVHRSRRAADTASAPYRVECVRVREVVKRSKV